MQLSLAASDPKKHRCGRTSMDVTDDIPEITQGAAAAQALTQAAHGPGDQGGHRSPFWALC